MGGLPVGEAQVSKTSARIAIAALVSLGHQCMVDGNNIKAASCFGEAATMAESQGWKDEYQRYSRWQAWPNMTVLEESGNEVETWIRS